LAISLTINDIKWLKKNYPNINIDTINNIIYGSISFKINFEGYRIEDEYSIKVNLNNLDTVGLPKVFETSGKIYNIAQKYNILPSDLHINDDGSFCLVIEGEEDKLFQNNFTVKEFFENSIEKFLYQISFYEKEGYFPWGEYAHGYLGLLELYAENGIEFDILLSKLNKIEILEALLINRQSQCLCGSGKKLRKCHPLIFKGINKLKSRALSIGFRFLKNQAEI
jgi:hypothetical protein